MKKMTVFLILLAMVLSACQSSNANANNQPTKLIVDTYAPAGTQGPVVAVKGEGSNPKPGDVQALLDAGAVIILQRGGGFAGVNEQWSFYPDGKIVKDYLDKSKPSENLSVDAAQVTALLDALKAAGFFEMKSSAIGGGLSNCNDCYTYKLTAVREGITNSISIQENSTGSASALEQLVKQLIGLTNKP